MSVVAEFVACFSILAPVLLTARLNGLLRQLTSPDERQFPFKPRSLINLGDAQFHPESVLSWGSCYSLAEEMFYNPGEYCIYSLSKQGQKEQQTDKSTQKVTTIQFYRMEPFCFWGKLRYMVFILKNQTLAAAEIGNWIYRWLKKSKTVGNFL